jgi:hypothetical protein
MTPDDHARLLARFSAHLVTDEQALYRMQQNRSSGFALARTLVEHGPAGPELDRAIDLVEQAVMLANAALARAHGHPAEDPRAASHRAAIVAGEASP